MKKIAILVAATMAVQASAQENPPVTVAPSIAQPIAVTPVTPTRASTAKAHDLAALFNSDEVTKIQRNSLFGKTIPDGMHAKPAYQRLEKKYPGIVMAIVAGTRPTMEAAANARAPQLIASLAALYARYLTAAELDGALAFFRSPTGHRVILAMANGLDASKKTQVVADSPAQLAASDIDEMTSDPVTGLNPERLKALNAFRASNVGRKLDALEPQVGQIDAEWANALRDASLHDVNNAMLAAGQKYIADHGGPSKAAPGS